MSSNLTKKNQLPQLACLEAGFTNEQKILMQRAAGLAGLSVSEFIISSAQEAALRTIRQNEIVQLTMGEREPFVKALLNPIPPGARLKKAASAYRKKGGVE